MDDSSHSNLALELDHVSAGYGPTIVIHELSLRIKTGETVAVLGRNGVGKSTLLSTVMGHTRMYQGSIRFRGQPVEQWPTWRRSRSGMGLVPQEREIFAPLSVEENLSVAVPGTRWTIEGVYKLFPLLAERRSNRGNQLSGGEQQMLAVGRALMGDPSLLLLDEPLEGLAPAVIDTVFDALKQLRDETDLTILLVEQNAPLALQFAPRTVVLDRGQIVFEGSSDELIDDEQRLRQLIGVTARQHQAGDAHPPVNERNVKKNESS